MRPVGVAASRQIAILEKDQTDQQHDGRVQTGIPADVTDVTRELLEAELLIRDEGRSGAEEFQTGQQRVKDLSKQ